MIILNCQMLDIKLGFLGTMTWRSARIVESRFKYSLTDNMLEHRQPQNRGNRFLQNLFCQESAMLSSPLCYLENRARGRAKKIT